ncbi:hypothetical protein [Streptomyces sp. AcH 505]
MICARCDKPMKAAEAEERDVPGNSGGVRSIWVHKKLCPLPLVRRFP